MVLSSWSDSKISPAQARASWLASLEPKLDELREAVRRVLPAELAARSGVLFEAAGPPALRPLSPPSTEDSSPRAGSREGDFWLRYLGHHYRITWPDLVAYPESSLVPCPANLQSLFLYYLNTADGTLPTGVWMALRELPGGHFYAQAFQGYTGDRLVKVVGSDLKSLARAARKLGGFRLDFGDAAFRFDVLPRIPLALVYWLGDEEFPPSAQVLFDATASHYMPTDGLAVLGSHLIDLLADEMQG